MPVAQFVGVHVSVVLAAVGVGLAVGASALGRRLGALSRRDRTQIERPRRRKPGGPSPAALTLLGSVPSAEDYQPDNALPLITWALSRERQAYVDRRHRTYISAMGGGVLVAAAVNLNGYTLSLAPEVNVAQERTWVLIFGVLGLTVVAYSFVPYFAARSAYRQRRSAMASAQVDKALDEACGGDTKLELNKLFQLNRRQLDEYQIITRKQQRLAFICAQVASGVAFVVLVSGAVAVILLNNNVEKYIAGGLSALGTALSAFVAATFFRSVDASNVQMNRYYLEPQRTGRLLAGERLISVIQDSKDAALLSAAVTAVLSWEMPDQSPPISNDGAEDKPDA